MSDADNPWFELNWLTWTVERPDRTFRIYVVEPRSYALKDHPAIFDAALSRFLPQAPAKIGNDSDVDQPSLTPANTEWFDLLTFPEAFLDLEKLLEYLRLIDSRRFSHGCIHVGLRPPGTDEKETHLFNRGKIADLVEKLKSIRALHEPDLSVFCTWLAKQGPDDYFNLGCIFAVEPEPNLRIRICLHPKLVHSVNEQNILPEHDMKEANLLSLVTLRSTTPDLLSVNVQPLLCSDALHLDTYRPNRRPLQAMTYDANLFKASGNSRREHVDIVSVATCTPNESKLLSHRPRRYRQTWHNEFRRTFERAAKDDDYRLHKDAIFVLSNFYDLPLSEKKGGLSGAFIPLPCNDATLHKYMDLAVFGRPQGPTRLGEEAERWVYDQFENKYRLKDFLHITGYIAAFNPAQMDPNAVAAMVGFSVSALPRDTNRNRRTGGIRKHYIYDAFRDTTDGTKIEFKRRQLNEH